MSYIVFKTKYTEGLDQPAFIPTGTYSVEANGTYNITNYEFINVFVQNKKIKQVAMSNTSTWILTQSGDLYGCGDNSYGQQGYPNSAEPYYCMTFTKRLTDVDYVDCSVKTTWAIKKDGTLWGCGNGTYGQQGDGDTSDHHVPYFAQRATNVKRVFCYDNCTWYVKNDGTLWGCGDNDGYDIGTGSATPSKISTFTQLISGDIVKLRHTGYRSTFALKADGTLWNWGSTSSNKYYNITITPTQRMTDVSYFETARAGDGSVSAVWALKTDGTFWGCGANKYGEQGNGKSGTSSSYFVPNFTQRLDSVKDFDCSGLTTWAIKNDGTLWGTGYNGYGQQGLGNFNNALTFTQRMTDVKKVFCVENDTWALKTDSTLWGCGYNNIGQQSTGDTTNVSSFTQRLTNVKDVYLEKKSGTADVVWALKNDGTLWGCGRNNYGQQGSGNANTVYTFTQRELS